MRKCNEIYREGQQNGEFDGENVEWVASIASKE
jgi:hypothetical protein